MNKLFNFLIAAVWSINGLFSKVLNLVPRHQEIVARICGREHSGILTLIIGIAEIIMAIWVLSKYKSRLCAILQILIVSIMNILEFIAVPDLLLWGKFNSVFALLFVFIIYYNEFSLHKKKNHKIAQ